MKEEAETWMKEKGKLAQGIEKRVFFEKGMRNLETKRKIEKAKKIGVKELRKL